MTETTGNRLTAVEDVQMQMSQRLIKLETDSNKDFAYCERHVTELRQRIVNLEQQVANQALAAFNAKTAEQANKNLNQYALSSQAAATQATEHLYAPLRSDTKPLLEMSAFVRKIADIQEQSITNFQCRWRLQDLINEASDILKSST